MPNVQRETEQAKGMALTAIVGVVTALLVYDFIYGDCEGENDPVDACGSGEDTYNVLGEGIAGTVTSFIVPIVAVAVLLKVMGYI